MPTDHFFNALGKNYTLLRYPINKKSELRAWDTADQYLLDMLSEFNSDLNGICIINDSFGALTLPLLKHNPICYSDSWLSREALYNNIEANGLSKTLSFLSTIDQLDNHPSPHIIIGRIPKSKSQLAFLLQQLHKWAEDGTYLLLTGMDKGMNL